MTKIIFLLLITLTPFTALSEKLSFYAYNISTDEIEISKDENVPLTPASTAKLFPIFGTLKKFGPNFTYEYEGYLTPQSDLIVKLPPDPLFTTETLFKLAEKIKALGVPLRTVTLDISAIKGGRGRVGLKAYESAIKGVFFNFNSIEISACRALKRSSITTFPAWAQVSVVGSLSTKSESPLDAECRGFQCVVSGTIDSDESCQSIYRSIDEPEGYLSRSFTRALKDAEVLVSQGVKVSNSSTTKSEAKAFTLRSRPLYDSLRATAHVSTNVIAEALVFLLGKDEASFSYQEGIRQLQQIVKENKSSDSEILVDGSGLSHDNKISSKTLVTLLKSAHEDYKINYDFISLMPVGGQSGTLKTRDFGEATPYVRAKTGSLDGVSTLAGYLTNKDKELIAFAILQNEVNDPSEAKKREEQIIKDLY